MNIQPHEIIGALAALGLYPPAKILIRRAALSNDIGGLSTTDPTPIPWDTGDFDPSNPTRIYVPSGFSYALVTGQAYPSGSGNPIIRAWYNGNTATELGFVRGATSSPARVALGAFVWPVSDGDYFELAITRENSLTGINSDNGYTSFSLVLFP